MPTLLLSFPARRYHATPWMHHVNEGVVEWPPSPWRVLRALVSVGYTTMHWSTIPDPARRLFGTLASVLPTYRLPRAVASHSRHYMPIGGLRGDGIENTTLVFDTWARIDDGVLAIDYPVDLEPDDRSLLAQLLGNLGYLGRSESWVEARLLECGEAPPLGLDVFPSAGNPPAGGGWDQISLFAPLEPEAYLRWRADFTAEVAANGQATGTKARGAKKRSSPPDDVVACLEARTSELRNAGWSQPPGSRRVLYWRPVDALDTGPPRPTPRPRSSSAVETMLLALSSRTNNTHALPPNNRALPQAERLHRALVRHVLEHGHSEVLTGCSSTGTPLLGHRHAHVLPLDLDGDGHLDHVLLWAPRGLDPSDQLAARSIRRTHAKGLDEIRVALVGAGSRDDLLRVQGRWALALAAILGPKTGAREWISKTPFVAPRHVKSRGRNTLTGQVVAELASRGLPAPNKIEILDPRDQRFSPIGTFRHYAVARRNGHRPPPQRLGVGLKLTFAEPLRGPLCLGYASHFGLGRFDAISEEHTIDTRHAPPSAPLRVATADVPDFWSERE